MNFIIEIHKLCLYGDVALFNILSSKLDFDTFMLKYDETMLYCFYKGAYINKFFFDLLSKYGSCKSRFYKQLYNVYYGDSDYLFHNVCQLKSNFKAVANVDKVYFYGLIDYFDISIFTESGDEIYDSPSYGIVNFDKYIFNLFLGNKYVSNFCYDYTEHDILSNTDLAMYLYSRKQHVDLCLSRFIVVDYDTTCKLVTEDTFFTFFCNTPSMGYDFEHDNIDVNLNLLNYKQIMLIYFYVLLYQQSYISELSTEFIEKFDFVEYNILRLVNYSNDKDDVLYFNNLLRTRKIVKLFDIPSKEYMYEEIVEVENLSDHEYKCLIYNWNF